MGVIGYVIRAVYISLMMKREQGGVTGTLSVLRFQEAWGCVLRVIK